MHVLHGLNAALPSNISLCHANILLTFVTTQISEELAQKLARMQHQERSWQQEVAKEQPHDEGEQGATWSAAAPFGGELVKKLQQRNEVSGGVCAARQTGRQQLPQQSPSDQQPMSELQARFQRLRREKEEGSART